MTRRVLLCAIGALVTLAALLVGPGAAARADTTVADLRVQYVPGGDQMVDRSAIAVMITVTNAGPDDAADTVVSASLPAGAIFVGGSFRLAQQDPSNGQCAPLGTAEVRCTLDGPLPARATANAFLAVRDVGATAGATIALDARVTSAAADPAPGDNAIAVPLSFAGGDLSVQLGDHPVLPSSGSLAEISFQVTNAGPLGAPDVYVALTIPLGLVVAQARILPRQGVAGPLGTCGWEPSGARYGCSQPGWVSPGGQVDLLLTVVNVGLPAGSSATLFVELGSAMTDPDPTNNFALIPVTLTGAPIGPDQTDLQAGGGPTVGASVASTGFVFTNLTATSISGVSADITLPTGTQVASATAHHDDGSSACAISANRLQVSCTGITLAPLAGFSVHLVVVNTALPAGTTVEITAVVATSERSEVTPEDNRSVVPITFSGGPTDAEAADVGLAPSSEAPYAMHPSVTRTAIHVSSAGPAPATGVQISLEVPEGAALAWSGSNPGTEPPSSTPINCPFGQAVRRLVCTVAPMEMDATASLTIDVLNLALPAGTTVALQATVSAIDRDLDPTNNTMVLPVSFEGGPFAAGEDATSDLSITLALEPWHDPREGWVQTSWMVKLVGTASPAAVTAVVQLGRGLIADRATLSVAGVALACSTGTDRVTCASSGPLPAIAGGILTVHATYAAAIPPITLTVDAFVASDLPDPQPSDNHAALDLGVRSSSVADPLGTAGTAPNGSAPSAIGVGGANLPFTGRAMEPVLVLAAALVLLGLIGLVASRSLERR